MAEQIVYSLLCSLGDSPGGLETTLQMARLWVDHLRGPGGFSGRIALLTNLPELPLEGVERVEAPIGTGDRRRLFLDRVLHADRLRVRPGDRVMQLDLDALAVRPLAPLFEAARGPALVAAPSRRPPLDALQAGALLSGPQRVVWRLLRRGGKPGVSACVTCCRGEDWPRLMGRWASAIRGHRDTPPPLGDQSFLNLLHASGALPVQRFPEGLVRHVRATEEDPHRGDGPSACVVHFPIPERLETMRRFSVALTSPVGGGRGLPATP